MNGNKMKNHSELMAIVQNLRMQADALERLCRDDLRGDRHRGYSEDDGGRSAAVMEKVRNGPMREAGRQVVMVLEPGSNEY